MTAANNHHHYSSLPQSSILCQLRYHMVYQQISAPEMAQMKINQHNFWEQLAGFSGSIMTLIVTFGPTSRSHSPLPHLPFYFGHSTFGTHWDLGAGVFGTL